MKRRQGLWVLLPLVGALVLFGIALPRRPDIRKTNPLGFTVAPEVVRQEMPHAAALQPRTQDPHVSRLPKLAIPAAPTAERDALLRRITAERPYGTYRSWSVDAIEEQNLHHFLAVEGGTAVYTPNFKAILKDGALWMLLPQSELAPFRYGLLGADVTDTTISSPTRTTIRRADGVEEHYDSSGTGLKHSVVVPTRVDVVRGEIATAMEIVPRDGGVELLEGGAVRVRIGRAVVIDATGRRTDVPLEIDGSEWRIAIPSDAEFPVLVDPPIVPTTDIAIYNDTYPLFKPRVAYSPDDDAYLVAMEATFSAADHDLYALKVSRTGVPQTSYRTVTIAPDQEVTPDVCYNPTTGHFLFVYDNQTAGNIYAVTIDMDGGGNPDPAIVTGITDVDSGTTTPRNPRCAARVGFSEYYVCWDGSDGDGSNDGFAWRVNSTLGLVAGITWFWDPDAVTHLDIVHDRANDDVVLVANYDTGNNATIDQATLLSMQGTLSLVGASEIIFAAPVNTAFKRHFAIDYSITDNTYLLVWDDNTASPNILARRYTFALGTPASGVTGTFTISSAANTQTDPDLAYNSPFSGATNENVYCVVWSDSRSAASRDIYGQIVYGNGTLFSTDFELATSNTSARYEPCVVHNGEIGANLEDNNFFVVWSDERNSATNENYFGTFVRGTVVRTDTTPDRHFFTIQGAINNLGAANASAVDIEVRANGTLVETYKEQVAINLTNTGTIALHTPSPYDTTVTIDGSGMGSNAYSLRVASSNVTIQGFRLTGMNRGLQIDGPGAISNITIRNCVVFGNTQDGVLCGLSGFAVTTLNFFNNTFIDNGQDELDLSSVLVTGVTLRNNIIWENTAGFQAIDMGAVGQLAASDYNDLYVTGGGNFEIGASSYASLALFRAATGMDANSISVDPVFVAGANEYHLRSTNGRVTNAAPQTFGNDASNSPCIDAGNPEEDYQNETANRGSAINMGAYGNTAQASRGTVDGYIWIANGGGTGNWTTNGNWAGGSDPPNNSNVHVLILGTLDCVINNNRAVGSLTVGSAARLLSDEGVGGLRVGGFAGSKNTFLNFGTIDLENDDANIDGRLDFDGTVFDNRGTIQSIAPGVSGSSNDSDLHFGENVAQTFDLYNTGTLNVDIRLQNGTLRLQTNVTTAGWMRIEAGEILNLNGFNLTLNGTSTLTGNATLYMAGTLVMDTGAPILTLNGSANNNGNMVWINGSSETVSAGTIRLTGNWENQDTGAPFITLTGTNTVEFTGPTAGANTATIRSPIGSTFMHVTINATGGVANKKQVVLQNTGEDPATSRAIAGAGIDTEMDIDGDFTLTNGDFDIAQNDASDQVHVRIAGNFTATGGSLTHGSTGEFVLDTDGTKTLSITGAGISPWHIRVLGSSANGRVVNLTSALTISSGGWISVNNGVFNAGANTLTINGALAVMGDPINTGAGAGATYNGTGTVSVQQVVWRNLGTGTISAGLWTLQPPASSPFDTWVFSAGSTADYTGSTQRFVGPGGAGAFTMDVICNTSSSVMGHVEVGTAGVTSKILRLDSASTATWNIAGNLSIASSNTLSHMDSAFADTTTPLVQVNGNVSISGTLSLDDGADDGGMSFAIRGNWLNNGNLTLAIGATSNGPGLVTFNGGTAQTIDRNAVGTKTFGRVVINQSPASTVTVLNLSFNCTETLTITSGTFELAAITGNTVGTDCLINGASGALSFGTAAQNPDLAVSGNFTKSAGGLTMNSATDFLDVNGAFTVSGGTVTINDGDIYVAGNVDITGVGTFAVADPPAVGQIFRMDGAVNATVRVSDVSNTLGRFEVRKGGAAVFATTSGYVRAYDLDVEDGIFEILAHNVEMHSGTTTLNINAGGGTAGELRMITAGGLLEVEGSFNMGAGAAVTISNGEIQIRDDLTANSAGSAFDPTGGTVRFDGSPGQIHDVNFDAGDNFFHLQISPGGGGITFRPGATATLDINGNFTINAAPSGASCSVSMVNGANLFTMDLEGNFTMVTGAVPSTFVPSTPTHTVGGSWDDSGGVFQTTTGTISFDTATAGTVKVGAANYFNHFSVAKTGTLSFDATSSPIEIKGNYTQLGGTVDPNTVSMEVEGNWTESGGTFAPTSADVMTVTFDRGAGTSTITQLAANNFWHVTIATTGGGIVQSSSLVDMNGDFTITTGTYDPNGFNMEVERNWDDSGGTFNPAVAMTVTMNRSVAGTSTLRQAAANRFRYLTQNATGTRQVTATSAAVDIDGNFTISAGTFDPNGINMEVSGNWSDTGGTFTPASATVAFDRAAGTSTLAQAAANNFFHLTVATTGGGIVQATAGPVDVNGAFLVTTGDYQANGVNLEIAGNFTIDGTFTHGSATVTFNGTGSISGATATLTFNNVTVSAGTRTDTRSIVLAGALSVSGGTLTTTGLASAATIDVSGTITLGDGAGGLATAILELIGPVTLRVTPGSSFTSNAADARFNSNLNGNGNPAITRLGGAGTIDVNLAGTVDIQKLTFSYGDTEGLNITASTVTNFRNVDFPVAITAGRFVTFTGAGLNLDSPGCVFAGGPDGAAIFNVLASGAGSMLRFEDRGAAITGAGAGEGFDSDNDTTPQDGIPDAGGAVVYWCVSAGEAVTGSVQLSSAADALLAYPTAAYNFNTGAMYSVYVVTRDRTGAGTADRIWVLNKRGDAKGYFYDVPQANGDVVGTPFWYTIGTDQVLFFGTSAGYLYYLLDTGNDTDDTGALSDQTGWPFKPAVVDEITSPINFDGGRLFFGGLQAGTPKMFGVSISTQAVVHNRDTTTTVRTFPGLDTISAPGFTYVFSGTDASAGTARVWKMRWNDNLGEAQNTASKAHHLRNSANTNGVKLYIADYGGRVFQIDGTTFLNDWVYYDDVGNATSAHPAVPGASPGPTGQAVYIMPYVQGGEVYFGDADGHLYKLTAAGALSWRVSPDSTFAIKSSPTIGINGSLYVGNNNGRVFKINPSTGATQAEWRLDAGVHVSDIVADNLNGTILVITSNGKIYYVPQ